MSLNIAKSELETMRRGEDNFESETLKRNSSQRLHLRRNGNIAFSFCLPLLKRCHRDRALLTREFGPKERAINNEKTGRQHPNPQGSRRRVCCSKQTVKRGCLLDLRVINFVFKLREKTDLVERQAHILDIVAPRLRILALVRWFVVFGTASKS